MPKKKGYPVLFRTLPQNKSSVLSGQLSAGIDQTHFGIFDSQVLYNRNWFATFKKSTKHSQRPDILFHVKKLKIIRSISTISHGPFPKACKVYSLAIAARYWSSWVSWGHRSRCPHLDKAVGKLMKHTSLGICRKYIYLQIECKQLA